MPITKFWESNIAICIKTYRCQNSNVDPLSPSLEINGNKKEKNWKPGECYQWAIRGDNQNSSTPKLQKIMQLLNRNKSDVFI